MQINGLGPVQGPQSVQGVQRNQIAQPEAQKTHSQGADQLDISHEADLVSRARDLPDIRADRVAEIRAQIESGIYETEEKLDIALDRLLDELA